MCIQKCFRKLKLKKNNDKSKEKIPLKKKNSKEPIKAVTRDVKTAESYNRIKKDSKPQGNKPQLIKKFLETMSSHGKQPPKLAPLKELKEQSVVKKIDKDNSGRVFDWKALRCLAT
ncbi:hypothetical protein Q1695_009406 [Nippostrongylus brasiliensis]|nr:hypothetical protein Q1695_009406 [Nippostrongylus brasiliensis]